MALTAEGCNGCSATQLTFETLCEFPLCFEAFFRAASRALASFRRCFAKRQAADRPINSSMRNSVLVMS